MTDRHRNTEPLADENHNYPTSPSNTPDHHADEDAADHHAVVPAGQATYVHPEAAALFELCPWIKKVPLFTPSCKAFGPRGVTSLGLCYFLNKGLGSYLVKYARFPMFTNRFGIDGTRYQRLSTLYTMGWSVKAFSACISDTFALFGYTKRWYCAGSCIAGGAFALAFALLPAKVSSANMGAGFMFLTNFCMANVDILSEGHYSRTLRKRPAAGPALVSWIWVFIFVASLVSAAIQGPLSDKKIPQVGLFISAACQLLTVFFFIFNWYGERYNRVERYEDVLVTQSEMQTPTSLGDSHGDAGALAQEKELHPELGADAGEAQGPVKNPATHATLAPRHDRNGGAILSDELVVDDARGHDVDDDDLEEVDHNAYITTLCCGAVEVNKEVFLRNWRLFVYSATLVSAIVAQSLVTVYGTSRDLGWSSLAVAVVCCGMAFWSCTFVTAKAICFVFLDMLLYIQISGATDSFYMAPKSCLPDGPHFDYVFYTTIGSVIGNLGGIAGVMCFSYIFSKRSYWFTFIFTTIIKVVSSVFDIIIVKRWNVHIGIPDHAMYILGDAIVFQVCTELAWMPVVLLFSRVCPRGSESIIYALAAGFSNMGQSMSSAVGSLFLELVWPIKTKGTCDFSNLPMLLLVTHILIPLAVIPLSILLLPRARICDDIDADGNLIKKEKGSDADASKNQLPGAADTSSTSRSPNELADATEHGDRRAVTAEK